MRSLRGRSNPEAVAIIGFIVYRKHWLAVLIYGFLQGAWPFGIVEAIWALVALRRWLRAWTRRLN